MLLHLPVLEKVVQLSREITGTIVREQAATMFHLCMGHSRGGERHGQHTLLMTDSVFWFFKRKWIPKGINPVSVSVLLVHWSWMEPRPILIRYFAIGSGAVSVPKWQ